MNFTLFRKYDPEIYIDKNIEDITFNDVLYIVDEFPNDLQIIIRPIAIGINANIKPKEILNIQKQDIFIPDNSGQVEKARKLWEGWLLFLIYMQLHDIEIKNENYDISTGVIEAKLKMLYADGESDFSSILHHLKCTETFKSRRITHYIFTNQSGKLQPNILTQKQISNIIPDITTPNTIMDDKAGKKKFGCFHLEELNQRVSKQTLKDDLNSVIKEEIIKVLENAFN
ncbi:MAG: hypothetical protein JXQ67_05105 [Campylobacterales bacterium]|nr:hypothetical protein [Campylobacterales bacterium]